MLATYTYAVAFDRTRGILFVQTPDPLSAEVLAHRFHTTIMRTVHNLQLALGGVPIQAIAEPSAICPPKSWSARGRIAGNSLAPGGTLSSI